MAVPYEVKTGTYTGNGTSQSVTLGFKPMKVEIINITDGDTYYIHINGMTDATGISIAAATAGVSANGVTLSSNGFSVGSDVSVNENAKTFRYLAYNG